VTKKQCETHKVVVRWGSFFPFLYDNINKLDGHIEVNLFGAGLETNNPDRKLVYHRPDTLMQDKNSSKSAPGKISFQIKSGNQVSFKQKPQYEDDEYQNETPMNLSTKRSLHRRQSSAASSYMNEITMKQQQQSVNDLYKSMIKQTGPVDIENSLQMSQANQLLMSQLQQANKIVSDNQRLTGLFGGNLELYPIHNAALHMPILALDNGQIGGRTMSRAAYAKLKSANFAPIKDRFGQSPEIVDAMSRVQFNLDKEESDPLSCNQIFIQFLAFSRTVQSLKSGTSENSPKNIHLTFQFYRFDEFKTPKLKLDKPIEDYSMDANSAPFILKEVYRDENKNSNKSQKNINASDSTAAGYMVSYNIDPTNLKFGEKKIFLHFLAHQTMFIDVWDADSLHLIGTASIQLKELLRQNKEAVQSTFELDIINTEYDNDDGSRILNAGHQLRENVAYAYDSHIKVKGILHLRMANVGSPLNPEFNNDKFLEGTTPSLPLNRVIASKSSLDAYGERLLSVKLDQATANGLISHNMSKAHHMTETFKDIHVALSSNKSLAGNGKPITDANRDRKLKRMEIVRQRQKTNEQDIPIEFYGSHRRLIQERDKDLKVMAMYRQQTKHDQIMNKLHNLITTEYAIYPNFGTVEFFEFIITNPFQEAQNISIIIDDPDLKVVTDGREWRHLKLLHQIYTQVEDNMFHLDELARNSGIKYPQLLLRPKESMNIPLKFQTFKADSSIEHYENSSLDRIKKTAYPIRKATVYFRAENGTPIAILSLIIDQQSHVINQTFRISECEHSFMKKLIRLPSSTRVLAAQSTALLTGDIKLDGSVIDQQGTSQIFVRSNDASVICESRAVSIGEPHDVFIKVN
jgi:nephrocystin-4